MESIFGILAVLAVLALVTLIVLAVSTTGERLRSRGGSPRPERRRPPAVLRGVLWIACAALGMLFIEGLVELGSTTVTGSDSAEALTESIFKGIVLIGLLVIGALFIIVCAIAALVSRGLRRRDPTS
jgi:hypothetical protein